MTTPLISMENSSQNSMKEKQFLVGIILNDEFIRTIHKHYKSEYIDIPFIRPIADICFEYFVKFKQAPKGQFKTLILNKMRMIKDETVKDLTIQFINSLEANVEHFKNLNFKFILEDTINYFNEKSALLFQMAVNMCIKNKDFLKLNTIVNTYKKHTVPYLKQESIFGSNESLYDAIEGDDTGSIINFKGALDEFFYGRLKRGEFIGIIGREKIGKTYILSELALQSAKCRNNTLVIQCGDMTSEQFKIRLAQRILGRTKHKTDHTLNLITPCKRALYNTCDFDKRILDEKGNTSKHCTVCKHQFKFKNEYEPDYMLVKTDAKEELTYAEACRIFEKFKVHTKGKIFDMYSTFTGKFSIDDLENLLEEYMALGNPIDVVVLDYADIMFKEFGKKSERDNINELWSRLRAISIKYNILLITASQGNRDSYTSALMTMNNASEDKRILSHVTGMIGLNKIDWEVKHGLMRLNWIAGRDIPYHTKDCVALVQNLAIANPLMDCFWCSEQWIDRLIKFSKKNLSKGEGKKGEELEYAKIIDKRIRT